jgi:hypothetical protein
MAENESTVPALYTQRPAVEGLTLDAARAELAELGRAPQGVGRLERMEQLAKVVHGGGQGEQTFPDMGQGSEVDPEALSRSETTFDAVSAPRSSLDYANALPDAYGPGNEGGNGAAQIRELLFKEGVSPGFASLASQMNGHFEAVGRMSPTEFDASVDVARDQVLKQPGGARVVQQAAAFLASLSDDHPLADAAGRIATTAPGIAELARLWRSRQRAA